MMAAAQSFFLSPCNLEKAVGGSHRCVQERPGGGYGRTTGDLVAKTPGHLLYSSEAAGWEFVGKAEDISPAGMAWRTWPREDPGVF